MTIEERLETLERELAVAKRRNRRLLAGVVLAVVLAVSGLGVAKKALKLTKTLPASQALEVGASQKVIRATQIILEDENGKTRVALDVVENFAGLSLSDENGKTRAQLGVSKVGPGLFLRDENGKNRVSLGMSKEGTVLSLSDENGKEVWSTPK